jgi:hypothetical protein
MQTFSFIPTRKAIRLYGKANFKIASGSPVSAYNMVFIGSGSIKITDSASKYLTLNFNTNKSNTNILVSGSIYAEMIKTNQQVIEKILRVWLKIQTPVILVGSR